MWLQPNISQPSLNPTHTVRVGCLVIRSHYVFSLSLSLCLFVSTPAPALVTKAMSKVPLSPRAPWDTRRHPSRAPSTPTRPTVTEAPSHSWTSRGVSSSSNQTSLYTIGPSQGVAPPSRSDTPPPHALHHSKSSILLFNPPFDLFPDRLQRHCNTTNIGTKKRDPTRSSASVGWWTIFEATENNVR